MMRFIERKFLPKSVGSVGSVCGCLPRSVHAGAERSGAAAERRPGSRGAISTHDRTARRIRGGALVADGYAVALPALCPGVKAPQGRPNKVRVARGLAAVVASCWLTLLPHDVSAAEPAATAPADQTVSIPATVSAFWSADLNAKTTGYVSEVKVDIGDRVKKDDVLAVISVPELDKSLAAAKATLAAKKQMLRAAEAAVVQSKQALEVTRKQLDSYRAESQYQQSTLKRQEELSAGHAATPQQLDEQRSRAAVAEATAGMGEAKVASAQADIQAAEANRDLAAAQVDVADAAVQEAEVLLAYTKITAPFDGTVARRLANPGDLVQAAAGRAAPLFTVQQADTVRVMCDVPEMKAAGVSVGAKADVKVYGLDGQTIPGTVTRLAGALDPTTRTLRVEIDLKNAEGALRPGMYAQVTLTLRPPARVAGTAEGSR